MSNPVPVLKHFKRDWEDFYKLEDVQPYALDLCEFKDDKGKKRMGWMVSKGQYDGYRISELGTIVAWRPITRSENLMS